MMITGSAIGWWSEYYRSHDAVQLGAAFGHLLSIAYAARYALGGDRAALRLTAVSGDVQGRHAARYLDTISKAHRHVLAGLLCALLTGAAQLLAQLDYLPRSPVFWTKMTMIVALLANGRIIQLTDRQLQQRIRTAAAGSSAAPDREAGDLPASVFHPLRAAAVRSIALWCTVLLLGLMLTTVRPAS
jgi:hypothetical protein